MVIDWYDIDDVGDYDCGDRCFAHNNIDEALKCESHGYQRVRYMENRYRGR